MGMMQTADNSVYPVKHVGDLAISPLKGNPRVLENVYHVPGMKLSVSSADYGSGSLRSLW